MSVGLPAGVGGGAEEATRHRRMRRWSIGHLAVALAAVLAFVANIAFLRATDDAVPVVVAARAIEAGETIGAGDLTTTRLRADAGVMATLLTTTEGIDGRVARRPLTEGELVGEADLLTGAAGPGRGSMAIPIDPSHAAGGRIRVGDRVDVVDVVGDGTAAYVARDVPVLAVDLPTTGALAAAGRSHVVLGVDESQVLALAEAVADGEVDVIVTTGAAGE